MFKWLIDRPPTLFGFVSGIFISVATTALSDFALADHAPENLGKLVRVALISFAAAVGWFVLGEFTSALKDRVKVNSEGIGGSREQAYFQGLAIVAQTESWKLFSLLIICIICSLVWPFLP